MIKEKDSLLERTLRKIIILIVVMAFVVPLITPNVFAASSVSINGGDNVKGGDTFTLVVAFEGGNIGRVDAYMTYDTNKLTYISGGTSSGNTGYIQLKTAGTEGSIVFNLKFQAVSEGAADLEVVTDEMYDFDDIALDRPSVTKTITISGNAAPEALITETASPEKPVDTTELAGVDEKTEKSSAVNLNAIFIAAAAVLVIFIVIISVILAKKKKKRAGDAAPGGSKNQQPGSLAPDNFGKASASEQKGFGGMGQVSGAEHSDGNARAGHRDRASGKERVDGAERMSKEETQVLDMNLAESPRAKQEQSYDAGPASTAGQPRIGRSGKILDASPAEDDSWLEDLMSGESSRKRRDAQAENIQGKERSKREAQEQANEETELWRQWDLNMKDDDSDDIEKW